MTGDVELREDANEPRVVVVNPSNPRTVRDAFNNYNPGENVRFVNANGRDVVLNPSLAHQLGQWLSSRGIDDSSALSELQALVTSSIDEFSTSDPTAKKSELTELKVLFEALGVRAETIGSLRALMARTTGDFFHLRTAPVIRTRITPPGRGRPDRPANLGIIKVYFARNALFGKPSAA